MYCFRREGTPCTVDWADFCPRKPEAIIKTTPELLVGSFEKNILGCSCALCTMLCTLYTVQYCTMYIVQCTCTVNYTIYLYNTQYTCSSYFCWKSPVIIVAAFLGPKSTQLMATLAHLPSQYFPTSLYVILTEQGIGCSARWRLLPLLLSQTIWEPLRNSQFFMRINF